MGSEDALRSAGHRWQGLIPLIDSLTNFTSTQELKNIGVKNNQTKAAITCSARPEKPQCWGPEAVAIVTVTNLTS